MRKAIFIPLCLVLMIALVSPVQAQDDDKYARFDNRFQIYLGGFFPQTGTVRLTDSILRNRFLRTVRLAVGSTGTKRRLGVV